MSGKRTSPFSFVPSEGSENCANMGFMGTRVMQVVFKQTGGLVWKNWPMNHTRRANAKKRHRRLRQVEDILRACAASEPVNHVKKDQAQAIIQAASVSHNARVSPTG